MASQTYVLVIPCQLSLKVLWWFASSVTQLSSQTVSSITPSGVLTIYKRQMKPEATIPLHTALFLYIIMSCSSLSLLHQSCETCDISIGFFFLRPEQGLALLNVSIAQNFSSWACLAPSSRKLNTLQAPPQTNSTHSIRYNHADSQSSLTSTKTLSASVGFLWRISRPTDSWSGAGIFFLWFLPMVVRCGSRQSTQTTMLCCFPGYVAHSVTCWISNTCINHFNLLWTGNWPEFTLSVQVQNLSKVTSSPSPPLSLSEYWSIFLFYFLETLKLPWQKTNLRTSHHAETVLISPPPDMRNLVLYRHLLLFFLLLLWVKTRPSPLFPLHCFASPQDRQDIMIKWHKIIIFQVLSSK